MVGSAVRCVREADAQGVSRWLAVLDTDDDEAELTREVADLLLAADAEMLRALRERLCVGPNLQLELIDDANRPLDIESVDLPLRCALRALLAAAWGDDDSCRIQLGLMFGESDAEMRRVVLAHILGWTADIVDTCEQRGAPVPYWL